MRTSWGIFALAVAAAIGASAAHAAPASPAADLPERWRTGVALGADRSGDVRPVAAAILDAAAAAPARALTLRDAAALGAPVASALETPATIRVWRRAVDGSATSCSGRVDVIPFEQYVRGVLPHEWIRSWNAESLKAGAVAIRTYAAYWVAAGGKYDCADLDDTTASQVYKDEYFADSDAAVAATTGVYVIKNDALVLAEYSAENSDPTATGVSEPLCTGRALNGHGRGTCQWGTQRWATDGKPWDWIVTHYYPGASLTAVAPALAASITAEDHAATVTSGDEIVAYVEYRNDGSSAWSRDQVLLGTTGPRDRVSEFWKADNWVDPTRPTALDQATVAPGATGRFTFAMVAPEVDRPTTYVEHFGLVTAGGEWFGPDELAVAWTITVVPRAGGPLCPDGSDCGSTSGGCSAGGAGGLGLALLVLALAGGARRRAAAVVAALTLGACGLGSGAPTPAPVRGNPVGGPSTLVGVFEQVAAESGVPAALLAATAYHETRLAMVVPAPDGDHGPAAWGLFGLTDGAGPRSIERAAALAGVDVAAARTDAVATTRAAAALLSALAGPHPATLAGWRAALVRFGGDGDAGVLFADGVLGGLARGLRGVDDAGRALTVTARPEAAEARLDVVAAGLGFPGAHWVPAVAGNFANANRTAADINYVVVHTTEGSYNGTISWFQNPSARVSSHYVIRSSDGDITQMVDDADVAYHDACFNTNSIGIEHEGFVADPTRWYTETMYMRSAALTAWTCDQYGIPKDRMHIYGHGDAPDCSTHTDPGPGWDWAHYMALVTGGGMPTLGATAAGQDTPSTMVSGDEAVVYFEFVNDSSITWGLDETRLGTAEPMDRASAFFVDGNWLSPGRATGADHSDYGPGAVGRFTFAIRAPEVAEPTAFHEAFQLVQEGVAWFGPVVAMDIMVLPRGGAGPDAGPDAGSGSNGGTDPGGVADGGCQAGGGGLAGPCVILVAGALFRRRRR
ncbi:MAG: N-acetylmuramoyl-L-alanine amidase [Kofleriaceae bacterium]